MFARIVTGLAPLMSEPARACEQADEALFGMRVEVLEEKKEWVRVRTHYRYEGWVERGRLFPEGEGTRDFDAAQKRILTKRCADLMREPRVQSSPRVSVPRGALLGVSGRTAENGWSEVILPNGSRAWTRTNYLAPHVTSAQGKDEAALRREIVQQVAAGHRLLGPGLHGLHALRRAHLPRREDRARLPRAQHPL